MKEIKVRIFLRSKTNRSETCVLYNSIFDPGTGVAFFPISKEWDIEATDLCMGRSDENNMEIYENYVITVPAGYSGDYYYKECTAIVKYEDDGFYAHNINDKDGIVWQDFNWSDVKVIGNIYDNPGYRLDIN